MRSVGRAIGLDVHRDFCEVAIAQDGEVRSSGRVDTTPERLELFGSSLTRAIGWRSRCQAARGRSRGSLNATSRGWWS